MYSTLSFNSNPAQKHQRVDPQPSIVQPTMSILSLCSKALGVQGNEVAQGLSTLVWDSSAFGPSWWPLATSVGLVSTRMMKWQGSFPIALTSMYWEQPVIAEGRYSPLWSSVFLAMPIDQQVVLGQMLTACFSIYLHQPQWITGKFLLHQGWCELTSPATPVTLRSHLLLRWTGQPWRCGE